jgi:hypothetical protein
MKQLKWMLNGALFTMVFCLIITLTIMVMSEMQLVKADFVVRLDAPAVTQQAEYLPLLDAQPQRDITVQRFAPVEVE